MTNDDNQMCVAVLAPFGKDCALIEKLLGQSGLKIRPMPDAEALVGSVPDGAGAAIVAEESLTAQDIEKLGGKVRSQPQWSDFPMIVLTGGGKSTCETELAVRARAPLGNVTLLERPLRAATLVSAARSALAARCRQYEIRDHLRQREVAEDALRRARDTLETIVQERTAALCRLSAQLLSVQDEERRRIARELHDGLGQYLAAAKITIDTIMITRADTEGYLGDVAQHIDRAIRETRTLSHLLHPPLLDAAGLASAAKWYVEGFGKRSGIEVSLELPAKLARLPMNVETALFRIMQEGLTNVHRHSGSQKVVITLVVEDSTASLVIRDFGKGMPREMLDQFKRSGTHVGVGLAGIRERVKELSGTFDIQSSSQGTILKVTISVSEHVQPLNAPTFSQIYSSLAS